MPRFTLLLVCGLALAALCPAPGVAQVSSPSPPKRVQPACVVFQAAFAAVYAARVEHVMRPRTRPHTPTFSSSSPYDA